MQRCLVVGVAGGTGSGKTTFARALCNRLTERGVQVALIAHDNYYRAHNSMPYEERARLNYDHPDAYETDLLVEHVRALRAGKSVKMPHYDFSVHNRAAETTTVQPAPVLIIEGILILAEERLRELMDIKVFVDVDADVRILRRLKRDVNERGRSVQSVIDQYLATVRPMHDAYVEPSKRYADVVVPALTGNEVAQELLVARICER